MTEGTLDLTLAQLKGAGYRIHEADFYKYLLFDKFQHIHDELWNGAVDEVIRTRTVTAAPKVAEWFGYIRTVYDKYPKVGAEAGTTLIPVKEAEHFAGVPTEKHVAAWRKLFGGQINFEQAPVLVLEEIMRAFREKRLVVSHLATFGTFFDQLQPTTEAIGIVRDVPKKIKATKRKNELVRDLIQTPSPVPEAEREAAAETPAEGSPPPPQPIEYTEEDLSGVPF